MIFFHRLQTIVEKVRVICYITVVLPIAMSSLKEWKGSPYCMFNLSA